MNAIAPSVIRDELLHKTFRLLNDGRLTITKLTGGLIEATCVGDTGTYRLEVTRLGTFCSCPARKQLCSHILALALVTGRSPREV